MTPEGYTTIFTKTPLQDANDLAEVTDLRASNARMSDLLGSIRDRLGLDDGGSILDAIDELKAMADERETLNALIDEPRREEDEALQTYTFLIDDKPVALADLPKGESFNLTVGVVRK